MKKIYKKVIKKFIKNEFIEKLKFQLYHDLHNSKNFSFA